MRIKRVFANKPGFKKIEFDESYNVVLADITKKSSDKDSRNGLGKSLLVEVINFCLGSGPTDNLKKEELASWVFGIEVEIKDIVYTFERSVNKSSQVLVTGDMDSWPHESTASGMSTFRVDDFNLALGRLLFGLSLKGSSDSKHPLKYRNLASYFMRSDSTAYHNPFKHMSIQAAWSTQACNAFLLGLNWEYALKLQDIKDRAEILGTLEKAAKEGILVEFTGSVGELEAERVRLATKLDSMEKQLRVFRVHEQYFDIQKEANDLTDNIHQLLNSLNLYEQTIKKYKLNLEDEQDVPAAQIERLYREVGINFGDSLKKKITEVQNFHKYIVKNRQQYLEDEIKRLTRLSRETKQSISMLSVQKENLMKVLQSHGALEEHSHLQEIVSIERQKLEEVNSRIQKLNDFANGMSKLSVEREELLQAMRQDYQERKTLVDRAMLLFNANSEFLYSEPGTLSAEVTKDGYKFKVDITRAGSDGVSNMKVFCYDMMLAELWSTDRGKPMPLVHDSKIFDGVDERQIAKALELAFKKSSECGFQYICTINSDAVPRHLFSEEFKKKFDQSIKVRYNDSSEDGTLLGFRF